MLAGSALALVCAFCWLGANVAIRTPVRAHGALGALVRAQLVALPLAVVLAFSLEGSPAAFLGPALLVLVLTALAAAVAYLGLFAALAHGRLAVVTPIIGSWAAVAVVVGVAGFGERPCALAWTGIALVLGGGGVLGALETRRLAAGAVSARPLLAAVAAALGFAGMAAGVKALADTAGPIWTVTAIWAVELLLLAPICALGARRRPAADALSTRPGVLRTALPGVLELAGFLALAQATTLAPLAVVGPISNLSAALTVLFGVVALQERLPPVGWIAAALAALGIVLTGGA